MKLIKIKKLGMLLVLAVALVSCSTDNQNTSDVETIHMKRFEESVLLNALQVVNKTYNSGKIVTNPENYVAFKIENFDQQFILRNTYIIDGMDYVDTGEFSDEVAGDGIYTSLKPQLLKNSKNSFTSKIVKSDKFKYNNKLATNKVKIGCKMKMVYSGKSWLGNSCRGGCIELYDCSFEIEF